MATDAALWSSEPWRDEATAWLDGALCDAGLTRTGEVTQPHLEPWSTVLTATTDVGRVWLKAMIGATAFEISLYDLLVTLAPEHVLQPIASDRARGLLVLRDGGQSLAERMTGEALVEAMVTALPQYASIQIAFSDRTETLIEMGLADLRPHVLPERYQHAGTRFGGTPIGERIADLEPDYLSWCDVVKGSPLPATLDHNDLHPWNILGVESAPGGGTTPAIVYDWGDSVVADPLGSAAIPISRVRKMVGLREGSRAALRMRDAYLEPFADVADRSDLLEMFDASCRLARASRAIVWDGSAEEIELYLRDLDDGFGGM